MYNNHFSKRQFVVLIVPFYSRIVLYRIEKVLLFIFAILKWERKNEKEKNSLRIDYEIFSVICEIPSFFSRTDERSAPLMILPPN